MRHIFTSPSSAYGGETRATRTCNAALHNMTTVEAAHIAYGCLQVRLLQAYILTSHSILFRFVLVSALRTLGPKSMVLSTTGNSTTYREFYNTIIELIEDSPDPEWKEDLLKAWNV